MRAVAGAMRAVAGTPTAAQRPLEGGLPRRTVVQLQQWSCCVNSRATRAVVV